MSTIVLRNVKGAALTFTEMDNNFTNLNSDKLEAVVSDTTPQLGGNLDVNGNAIVSASNGNIAITPNGTGKIVLDGLSWPTADGSSNYYLKTDGAGNLSWGAVSSDTNTTYSVSAETTSGGVNLRLTGSDASTDDVKLAQGSNITLTRTDANTITIAGANPGIQLSNLSIGSEGSASGDGAIAYNNSTGVFTYTPPTAAGIGALTDISGDSTPQLGGNLDVAGYSIISASDGNIAITPNGTGSIVLDGVNWPQADGTNGQVLQTNGSGQLSWSTAAGGGIDLSDLSVGTEGSASGDGAIAYNNSTGVFTYTPPTAAGIGALANVVEDTTPQLGGALDCQGNDIRNAVLEDYAETIHSLGSTDTPTITVSNGNVQSVTITSGLALPAFADAAAGQSVTLLVTGSGSATGTAAYRFAGGNKTLTTSSVVSIFYDGTIYWTSIATGFAA